MRAPLMCGLGEVIAALRIRAIGLPCGAASSASCQAHRAARFGQTRPGLLLNQAPHSRVTVLMGAPSGHDG